MPNVVHVTTVPQTLQFFRGQLSYMRAHGWNVTVISSPGEGLRKFATEERVAWRSVRMLRTMSPVADVRAFVRLLKCLERLSPAIVHAHTPKAGLLATAAAWALRVPVRIYHIHGLPYVTARWPMRLVLMAAEYIAMRGATRVLCVSREVCERLRADRLLPRKGVAVPHHGSVNGVDARGRFDPAKYAAERVRVRRLLGIEEGGCVFGFVGRLVGDKGIRELAAAWREVRNAFTTAHLIVIGPREERDAVDQAVFDAWSEDRRVHMVGEVWDTPGWYAAMDVVVLPSHREGFPVVPLEAAAMALPVITTDGLGCQEAVVDGVTGIVVQVGDWSALAREMRRYIADPKLREEHGHKGRMRVLRDFAPEDLWQRGVEIYEEECATRGVALRETAGALECTLAE